jgi:hypothetical protein
VARSGEESRGVARSGEESRGVGWRRPSCVNAYVLIDLVMARNYISAVSAQPVLNAIAGFSSNQEEYL